MDPLAAQFERLFVLFQHPSSSGDGTFARDDAMYYTLPHVPALTTRYSFAWAHTWPACDRTHSRLGKVLQVANCRAEFGYQATIFVPLPTCHKRNPHPHERDPRIFAIDAARNLH